MVEKLFDAGYDTLDKLLGASEEDFSGVYQFGEIMAHALKVGLNTLEGDMRSLLASRSIDILPPPVGGILSGISFCFTGELDTMKRSEAEERIKSLGGQAKSAVVKGLTYLVTNTPESGSSKNVKALDLGVAIIDEKYFIGIIEGRIAPSAASPAGSAKKNVRTASPQLELEI